MCGSVVRLRLVRLRLVRLRLRLLYDLTNSYSKNSGAGAFSSSGPGVLPLEAAPIGEQLFAHDNSQRDCAAF